jgi:3',5'-cyclic AMP phosphodiesterase CpdA
VTGSQGAAVPQSVVIAHVSDLHIGAHDSDATDTLVADVAAARPTLTVVTGDCTMRARDGQFRQAGALIARLPEPRLVVLGNHDLPLFAIGSRLVRPYALYRARLCADLDPVVRLPGVTALGLNSMTRWRWKSGAVSRRQTTAVVEILGGAAPGTLRLLALHHPPFVGGLARLVGRAWLTRAIVEAGVDLVLAGHTHLPAEQQVELVADGRAHHVIEVVAGTATSHRTRREVGQSWSLIRIDGDTIAVQERHHFDRGWQDGPTAQFSRQP